MYLYVFSFSKYAAVISLNSVNWFIFVIEMEYVFCEVDVEFLNIIKINLIHQRICLVIFWFMVKAIETAHSVTCSSQVFFGLDAFVVVAVESVLVSSVSVSIWCIQFCLCLSRFLY